MSVIVRMSVKGRDCRRCVQRDGCGLSDCLLNLYQREYCSNVSANSQGGKAKRFTVYAVTESRPLSLSLVRESLDLCLTRTHHNKLQLTRPTFVVFMLALGPLFFFSRVP